MKEKKKKIEEHEESVREMSRNVTKCHGADIDCKKSDS